jgi:hypothetical protein
MGSTSTNATTDCNSRESWGQKARKAVLGFIGAVMAGLVGAYALAFLAPWISERVAEANPTCDNPVGLRQINLAGLVMSGEARITGSPTYAHSPKGYPPDLWHPWKVADGRTTSVWAIKTNSAASLSHEQALRRANSLVDKPIGVLNVTFTKPQDVHLTCLVNGVPLDDASYRRSDRVRTLQVHSSCSSAPQERFLKSEPPTDMQIGQDIGVACDHLRSLQLDITRTYAGEHIIDPGNGNPEAPTSRVAIAEITFYKDDPNAPNVSWWPL